MAELQLPTVTEADLRAFHESRFGAPFPHAILMSQTDTQGQADEESYDDEDGLGYYPDGEKRTLTDEQIKMFRHSEIQALLRKRRQQEEQEKEHAAGAKANMKGRRLPPRGASSTNRTSDQSSKKGKTGKPGRSSQDSEEDEYEQFLQAERQEFDKVAAVKRNGERMAYDADDRTISTRRRVRDMDTFQATDDVLMYDDEPS